MISDIERGGGDMAFPEEMVSARQTAIALTINQRTYTVEARICHAPDGRQVEQYRVLLGQKLIKDWTHGNFFNYLPPECCDEDE